MTRTEIVLEYAPYHLLPAFGEGYVAYEWNNYTNPYKDGRDAQAWDRGLEAAMRVSRQAYVSGLEQGRKPGDVS